MPNTPLPLSLENVLTSELDPAFAMRARFVLEFVQDFKPKKILDAGCGRGFYPHALSAFDFLTEIHGIDIGDKYLAIAKNHCTDPRIKLQNASIFSLPFPDNYFDAVISSEVMEHLDDKQALLEIKRVLRPGGRVVLTVPNQNFPFLWDPLNFLLMKIFHTHVNKNIWWLAGMWADHERLYTNTSFRQLAEDTKLNVVNNKIDAFVSRAWPFTHFILYGIGKNVVEWFGTVDSFYRFNFDKKPLSALLARFIALPQKLLARPTDIRHQGLGVILEK